MNEHIKAIGREAGFAFIEDGVYGQRWYSNKCGMDSSEYEMLVNIIVQRCFALNEQVCEELKADESLHTAGFKTSMNLYCVSLRNKMEENFGIEESLTKK